MFGTNKMRAFEGVGKGQQAVLNIALGPTYHYIFVKMTGLDRANIGRIEVVANGQEMTTWTSGEQLANFHYFNTGEAMKADYLVIPFDRQGLVTRQGGELTALNTAPVSGIKTLRLRVDIIDNLPDGASPRLEAIAYTSSARAEPLPYLNRRHFYYDIAQAGDYEIYDLPRTSAINKIYYQSSKINSIVMRNNNTVVFERKKEENDLVLKQGGYRSPTAGMFVVDPTEQGYGGEGIYPVGLQEFRQVLNMESADRVLVTVEYFGKLVNSGTA